MDDFSKPYSKYISSGQKIEVINGKAYFTRPPRSSNPSLSTPSSTVSSKSGSSWFNGREIKRRKRIAKYKWYAVEGKVKTSLKHGLCWLKRKCNKIVYGL
uniref:DUF3511 domain-containing protein n=2 Tax=Davidia involucrata TaxID=16924 RepID=A0A5B7BLU6_DAVIN